MTHKITTDSFNTQVTGSFVHTFISFVLNKRTKDTKNTI